MIPRFGIILLAAGSSGRLGRPKQLLPFRGKILLQHLLDEATATAAFSVLVVLGAEAEKIKLQLGAGSYQVVWNEAWKEGMASSIRCGINALLEIHPAAEAAILMTCDQPFVTTALLDELMQTQVKSGKKIVTSMYDTITGPPALFHQSLFSELLQLKGDMGARNITITHAGEMATVSFPQGAIDIDTASDYSNL
jgi:molybdenum cofactor cytidylyltransferase